MAQDSTSEMILFPDYEALKNEVQQLRIELSMLYLERDELLYCECQNIETAYMLSVGGMEYRVFELECNIRRQKRKIEMIQAKKNRQEKIILSQIDRALDAEFEEYQAKLNERVEKMNDALMRSLCELLSDKDSAELKKLYRKIIKALHPDLHPEITHAQEQLFRNAVEAYERGDLNSIRIIGEMIADPSSSVENTDSMAVLLKEKERLTKLQQAIMKALSDIKSVFPYTMKAFIQSPERIDARKSELQEQINHLEEVLASFDDKLAEAIM